MSSPTPILQPIPVVPFMFAASARRSGWQHEFADMKFTCLDATPRTQKMIELAERMITAHLPLVFEARGMPLTENQIDVAVAGYIRLPVSEADGHVKVRRGEEHVDCNIQWAVQFEPEYRWWKDVSPKEQPTKGCEFL